MLGRPELAALAAPFAALLVVGLSLAETPRVSAVFDLDTERQVEGEPVEATLELRAETSIPRLEVLFDLPEGLVAETPNPQLLGFHAGRAARARATVSAASAGAPTSSATSSSARTIPSGCSSSSRPSRGGSR